MNEIKEIDNFYLKQEEPVRSCLLALKDIILSQDAEITNVLKYGMPFFCYKQKMFCYLWIHKKYKQPYLGMVEGTRLDHPKLIVEKRSRMKNMLFDPNEDLPIETIEVLLKKAINLYTSGEIKLK
jgi:Domain of unknown function (DU1801).